MQLCDVSIGDTATIVSLDFSPLFCKRLRDMGFCEGDCVECVRKAMFSSPILYYTKGAFVALRRVDARKIGVADE